MGMVIGIDVGGSTTKIVGIDENNQIIQPMFITAADPVTSLFGAFGKYLHDNNIKLEDIEQVMVTGVGSAFVTTPIYNLPTQMVDEFTADGLGARHYIGIDKLIVVSMGTGTTFVKIDHDGCFAQGCIHPIIGVFGILFFPLFIHYWMYKGIKACIGLVKRNCSCHRDR